MANCECGCGQDAGVYSPKSNASGSRRFIKGHNQAGKPGTGGSFKSSFDERRLPLAELAKVGYQLGNETVIGRQRKHGMCGTPAFSSWQGAIGRCTNQNCSDWKVYGGAGVTMYPRWLESFANFYTDMGPRPEGTSLGRILDRGNYEPGNCFWMTQEEQNLSRRNNSALRKWELSQKEQ